MFDYFLILLVLILGLALVFLVYDRHTGKTRARESTLYIEALRDLLDDKQATAFTKLRQVVAEDSNNVDAYLRLGQILREHNRPDRALQVHKDLTLRSGLSTQERIAILRQLALDYQALNELPTARAALKELISIDPRSHWAHTSLMKLQEQSQDYDEAYDTAVHVLKLESNKSKKPLARYKHQAGLQLYRKREYHKARVAMKEALGLDPTYVQSYLLVGDSYYEESRFEDAVNFWKKLIDVVPGQGHLVIDRLKRTLFELGRFGDIQEICQNILEHDPRNLEARRMLAEFYEKKGQIDQAVELLGQILDDYPEDWATALELIRFHIDKGDRKKLGALLRMLERKWAGRTVAAGRQTDSTAVGS